MRITPGMTADNAIYNLQQQRSAMDSLQEQITSQQLVNKPSDNPLTARQILDLQNQISADDQQSSNITKASLTLNVTSTALSSMSDFMGQIKTLAGSMVSGSSDATTRTTAANGLTQLRDQLIDLGNSKSGSQFVFGGFSTSQPFDAAGNYSGTSDAINVEVSSSGSQVATNVSGGALLRGGTPPAAVGSGATAGSSPVDIIGSLNSLITAISNNDTAGIADGIKNMSAASDQVNSSVSDVANRLVRMTNMQTMITSNKTTLQTTYDSIQSVDLSKAGVELSQMTTSFSAALSTTAKLTQLSLLDYLK
jgi:flagellar hook-associated protein 3 FlgL